MKKITVLLALLFVSITGFSQYKNIEIFKTVHYQDDSLNGCYIVITKADIITISDRHLYDENGMLQYDTLIAADSLITIRFQYDVYKRKQAYEKNKKWKYDINEIHIQDISFDADICSNFYDALSIAFKKKLKEDNPTWTNADINIEKNIK